MTVYTERRDFACMLAGWKLGSTHTQAGGGRLAARTHLLLLWIGVGELYFLQTHEEGLDLE